MTISPYQRAICHVSRPENVSRVAVTLVELLELFRDLEEVGYSAVVGYVEDRRLGIGVDGDDGAARLHAREVLHCARDAEGEIDLRLHRLAELADLPRVRHPPLVDERAGDGQGRAHLLGEALELPEVLLLADAGPDRKQERPRREVHAAARCDLLEVFVARPRAGDGDVELRLDGGTVALGRRPGRGANQQEAA